MKILKTIGLGLLALILLLVVVSFFLPSKVRVERSIVINTSPEVPFNLINNLKQWPLWSPWHKLDTNAVWEFSESVEGTNAWYTWKSENPNVGNGKLTITDSKPFDTIMTKLEFEGMDASVAGYYFTQQDGATKLTWTLECEMGMNPIAKFFGLMMDNMIGSDYEKGLASLKEISESAPKGDNVLGFSVEKKSIAAQQFVFLSNKDVKPEEIAIKIGEGFMKLDAFVKKSGNEIVGYPFTTWYSMSLFNVGLAVKNESKGEGDIKYNTQPAFDAFVVKYYGAYDKNQAVYEAMDKYIVEKGMTPAGPPSEVYITDPMVEKDTTKWLTEMVFPIK